jgi:hypothetical protein
LDALKKQTGQYNELEVAKLMKYYGFKTREELIDFLKYEHVLLASTVTSEMNNIFCRLLINLRMSFLWVSKLLTCTSHIFDFFVYV